MDDYERDAFLWSWNRQSADGHFAYVIRNAAIFALILAAWPYATAPVRLDAAPIVIPEWFIPALLLTNACWLASRYCARPMLRRALEFPGLALLFAIAAWFVTIQTARVDVHIPTLAAATAFGLAAGAFTGEMQFKMNSERFGRLMENGADIPRERPVRALTLSRVQIIFGLLLLAAIGPMLIFVMLQP
jgi:hypothetical protein